MLTLAVKNDDYFVMALKGVYVQKIKFLLKGTFFILKGLHFLNCLQL